MLKIYKLYLGLILLTIINTILPYECDPNILKKVNEAIETGRKDTLALNLMRLIQSYATIIIPPQGKDLLDITKSDKDFAIWEKNFDQWKSLIGCLEMKILALIAKKKTGAAFNVPLVYEGFIKQIRMVNDEVGAVVNILRQDFIRKKEFAQDLLKSNKENINKISNIKLFAERTIVNVIPSKQDFEEPRPLEVVLKGYKKFFDQYENMKKNGNIAAENIVKFVLLIQSTINKTKVSETKQIMQAENLYDQLENFIIEAKKNYFPTSRRY